jgi:hypothetical protein
MFLTICLYDSSIHNIVLSLSYTQIVENIQPFSDIINITIIYTNRQDRSSLHINCQYKYHVHKSSRTVKCFHSYVDNVREELNVLDDLCI